MPNLAFSVHPSLDSLSLSFSPPLPPYCAFLFVLGFRFFFHSAFVCADFSLSSGTATRQWVASDSQIGLPTFFFYYFVLFSICFSVCLYRRQLFNSRASEFFYSGERFVLARNKLTSHRFMVRTTRKINRRS